MTIPQQTVRAENIICIHPYILRTFEDKMILANNNLSGYLNSTSLSFKNILNRVLKQNFNYSKSIGGYLYLERNKTDSLLKKIKTNTVEEKNIPISEINLNYLSKLLKLCKEHGKNVFLIRSPQHKRYPGYSNESIYQRTRSNRYSSIKFLDFSKFPLKNAEFGDLQHLNHKGAKIFSTWFNNLLNSDFLKEKNKQLYINEEIKALILNK